MPLFDMMKGKAEEKGYREKPEPEVAEGAEGAPGGAPGAAPTAEDVAGVMGELEDMAAGGGPPPGAPGGEGLDEAAPEGMEGGADEAQPLVDRLQTSPEHAKMLLECMREIPEYADVTAEEAADMLASDMTLRMKVEEEVARKKEGSPEDLEEPPTGEPGIPEMGAEGVGSPDAETGM